MSMERAYTAKRFAKKMESFFEHCEQNDIEATDYALITFFGISPGTLDRYRSGEGEYQDFADSMRRLELYRENSAVMQVHRDVKYASHVSLRLRQKHWGGWSDKAEEPRTSEITIRINSNNPDVFG